MAPKDKRPTCAAAECKERQVDHRGGYTGHVSSTKRLWFCPAHYMDTHTRVATTELAFKKEIHAVQGDKPKAPEAPERWANHFVGTKRHITSWGHQN